MPIPSAPRTRRRRALVRCLFTVSPMLTAGSWLDAEDVSPHEAAPAHADSDAMQRHLEALEARVRELEQRKRAPAAEDAETFPGILTFGAYGELKYGAQRNPDAGGAWQNGFDGGRLTLLPSCQLSERILLKAEIEFEHGGMAFDDDDKLGGAVEVEQAYLDIAIDEHLHWRPPGIDVVPFGYTNLYHEPTLFYSVQRPELANGLIPTTWFEGATSIHGTLIGPVSYEFQISTSLVDDGGNVRDASDANTPADPLGYPAGVSGTEALGLARSTTSDFRQETDQVGYALRLAYGVPVVPGLDGSTSVYFSPDIEPRGAYASDSSNVKIGGLGRCALTMVDTELRYRPSRSGIELRAEAVGMAFSHPRNLRANNDGDPEDNVGRTMWGASAEVAYHAVSGSSGWEFVPFYRYTREVLQTRGVDGLDADAPTGAGRLQFHTVGVAVFPIHQVVLKLDYQKVLDASDSGARSDHILGGVGFFF